MWFYNKTMPEINPENSQTATNHSKNWFVSWFDSPYYHILYKDRDIAEAELFVDNITQFLNLPDQAKVLDLACGKGRHSIYLNSLGYSVLGADLSENSIKKAKNFENETLKFKVHDMRLPFDEKFDAVLNLFTSFGYFENDADNLTTLKAIQNSLNDYGFGVIDFMNVNYITKNLVPNEIKVVDGISFHIKRYITDNHIYKEIYFEDKGENYNFTEKVQLLNLQNFEQLMEEAEIYLLAIFGDYKLKKFHKEESERLIMIFK